MEGHCSTGQSSHRAVVPVEEEEGNLLHSYKVHFYEQIRQTNYVEYTNKAYSYIHCCKAKAISTAYYESVFVALSMHCTCTT
jgi:hypothetical protein